MRLLKRKLIDILFQKIDFLGVEHFDESIEQPRRYRVINLSVINVISADHAAHEACRRGVFGGWPSQLLSEDRRRHQ